ncbi:hypothetical protein [Nocardiopsis tropica]
MNGDERPEGPGTAQEPAEPRRGAVPGASTEPRRLGEGARFVGPGEPEAPPVPETPGRRVRSVVAWAGLGLLAGAAALAVWGFFGGLRTASREEVAGVWLLVPLLAAVLLAWAARMAVRAAHEDDLPVEGWAVAVLAAVSAGLAFLAFTTFPRDSFLATAGAPETYAPSQRATVLWLALCLTSLGGLLLAAAPTWPSPRRWGRLLLGFPAGVLAAAVAGALVPVAVLPSVLHTVAGPGDPAPEPPTVARVGWTWNPPPAARIQDVVRGSRGALVVLDDGVVALDGATGEELWSYRLPYADGVAGGAVDGAAYVTYTEAPEGDAAGPADPVTVLLDPGTGEVAGRFALSEEDREEYAGWNAGLRLRWDGPALSGRSVDGREELWSHTPAGVPGQDCLGDEARMAGDRVVFVHACLVPEGGGAGAYAVVGLDAGDGTEVWRHEWETAEGEKVPFLSVPPTGGGDPVVLLTRWGGARHHPPAFLDLDSGEEVAALPEQARESEHVSVFEDDVLLADTGGAVVRVDDWTEEEVLRVRVLGTGTAEVTDYVLGSGAEGVVLPLADAVLLPRMAWTGLSSGTVPDLMVVPFGDSVTEEGAEGVPVGVRDPRGREYDYKSLDLVAVPGAVAVHAEGADRVEGLVP